MIFPDGGFENGEKKTSAPPDMRFLELSWGRQDGSQDIANESRGLALVSANIEESPEIFRRVGSGWSISQSVSHQLRIYLN